MKKERKDKHFIKKPVYVGGPTALKEFISKNLRYPEAAKKQKIEGTVAIRYSINYKGKVVDSKIISGLGYGCNEEAARLVRLLSFQISKNRGVRALFHKEIHIHFKLPKPQAATVQYNLVPSSTKEQPMPVSKKQEQGYTITINYD